MRGAAVGQHCIECARTGGQDVRQPRMQAGGRQAVPVVTYVLIAMNVLTFILQMAIGNLERQLALWPPAVADGEYYRLVTAAFLHYGPTHLLLNMWALYVVGPPLENWLGRSRFVALYAVSGLGGSVLVYLLSPLNSATAGASGAVFGLFGATFVVARFLNLDFRWVVGIIAINLAFTFVIPAVSSQQISWQGHIGGLVTGVVVAAVYVYAPQSRRNLIQVSATAVILVVFAALIWWRTGVLVAELGI
jgi:membrane associated rhomboid family serine protease